MFEGFAKVRNRRKAGRFLLTGSEPFLTTVFPDVCRCERGGHAGQFFSFWSFWKHTFYDFIPFKQQELLRKPLGSSGVFLLLRVETRSFLGVNLSASVHTHMLGRHHRDSKKLSARNTSGLLHVCRRREGKDQSLCLDAGVVWDTSPAGERTDLASDAVTNSQTFSKSASFPA